MLDNDPPPGTPVVIVQDVSKGLRTLKAYEPATLVRSLGVYKVESALDLFEINYKGEVITVQRRDIRKAFR